MINAKVIGIGAAGNKAAINLIVSEVMPESKILLLNSTLGDVPEEYRHLAVKFNGSEGCGKERDLAGNICLSSIEDGTLICLDELLDPTDELVIVVNSSEGGTGCGSAHIVAGYMKNAMGADVHMFVFTGFEDDGRGLQNTIEYFQDIPEDVTVEAISNKNFLIDTTNRLKAQRAANDEFVKRVRILIGKDIVDSEQNIDPKDLYKVSTMPGYMVIGKASLSKLKNIEQFNKILTDMVDSDKSLATIKGMGRLGIILNVSEDTMDNIDFSYAVIKNKLGIPFETFPHIQYDGGEEYIAFIASGMKMPIDEVKEVYEKYKKESDRVNKAKDEFYKSASALRGNSEDAMFNTQEPRKPQVNKADFLKGFKNKSKQESEMVIVDVNKRTNNGINIETIVNKKDNY